LTPLQAARAALGYSQQRVADELRDLAWRHGHGELGIDANAVSRHERGVISRPRDPLPELYASLYRTSVAALWPGQLSSGKEVRVQRRRFLQTAVAAGAVALVPDDDLTSLQAITAGLQRLEATTPAADLQGPALAHLRLLGRRVNRGPAYAVAAAELARFAAWLAWDQLDHPQARALYDRAVTYAGRSQTETLVARMLGSWALWAAETGQGPEAVRVAGRIPRAQGPWLATMRATVAASVGDADTTLASLQTAERQLPMPGIPLTPASLQGYVGRCYAMLGLPKTAAQPSGKPSPPTRQHGTGRCCSPAWHGWSTPTKRPCCRPRPARSVGSSDPGACSRRSHDPRGTGPLLPRDL
jgi:hypothetical protein